MFCFICLIFSPLFRSPSLSSTTTRSYKLHKIDPHQWVRGLSLASYNKLGRSSRPAKLFKSRLFFTHEKGLSVNVRGLRPCVEGITRSGSALSYHLTRHPSSCNAQGSYPKRIYDVYTEETRYPLYTYLRRCSASRVNRAALFSVALKLPVEAFSCAHEQTRAHTSSCHHLFVSSHSQFN